jgi:hypothetical protein
MKVTLNTRTDLKTSSAELRTFDVKATTTLDGFKITATAKPSVPKLQLDGTPKITHPRSYSDVDFNAEVSKNDITVYFDNLQLVPDGAFAPRVKLAQRVVVGDASFAVDVEAAMKGNTATGKRPSAKDVITVNVKGPKVAGFTPKASYSNGSKGASVAAAGKIGSVDVEVKAERAGKDGDAVSVVGWVPLPEGARAKLRLKTSANAANDASGELEIHKGDFSLEVPIGAGLKPPAVGDVSLKCKRTFEFDA